MTKLMRRRRALMAAQGGCLPPVPSGYITDGLAFFLDGLQLATATEWTDIVGGKKFALTNCSVGTNGIVFDGTAYGASPGPVLPLPSDYTTQTIEVVIKATTDSRNALLSVPVMDDSGTEKVGMGLRYAGAAGQSVKMATIQDGTSKPLFRTSGILTSVAKINRVSVTTDMMVVNGAKDISTPASDSYGKNTSGYTYLGARVTDGATIYSKFVGTICAIRIYNKKLSEAEMKANQDTDLIRYLGG